MRDTEAILKARQNHHAALVRLAGMMGGTETNGLKIWRRLRLAEGMGNRLGLQLCNGPEMTEDEQDGIKNRIRAKVEKALGGIPPGFFINLDPRGYSLKLEEKSVPLPLHQDWGGYQILAPEINSI